MPRPAAACLIEFPLVRQDRLERLVPSPPPDASEAMAAREDAVRMREAEAFAHGHLEGLRSAHAEQEAHAAAAAAAFETRLEDERRRWAADEGERLARRIDSAIEALTETIGEAVAAVLAPVVGAAARDSAVAELIDRLRTLFADGATVSLSVSGPADLLDCVRSGLGARATCVKFTEMDEVDVRAVADRTTIETQLAGWTIPRDAGAG